MRRFVGNIFRQLGKDGRGNVPGSAASAIMESPEKSKRAERLVGIHGAPDDTSLQRKLQEARLSLLMELPLGHRFLAGDRT